MNPDPSGLFLQPSSPRVHVGRAREEEVLRLAFDQMRHGRGGVVLVSGEPGIGKSALVQLVRDASSPDVALVLTGNCYDLADSMPYGPWRQILSSAPEDRELTSLRESLSASGSRSPAGSQHELFEMVTAGLRTLAAEIPLVLVFEDIHWADRASLDLLRHVSHFANDIRLLIVATYRTDALEQLEILTGMLPSLVRESNAHRIELRRLGRDDILELVSSRFGLTDDEAEQRLARYLYSRGEGNPFFTLEIIRDLEDRGMLVRGTDGWRLHDLKNVPIPTMIQQVIALRLRQLDEDTGRLLDLASVIGQEVPVDLWQKVSQASDAALIDAIRQAESLQLASETGDGRCIRFDHTLVRETIYRGEPALLRRRQHLMIAEELLQQTDPAPDHLAHHLVQAEDPRAVEWLTFASQHAERLHAAHDARALASRAIDVAARQQVDAPSNAYRIRARACATIGDFDSAHQDLQAAMSAARRTGDLASERAALSDLGMLWSGSDYRRAGAYYKDALNVARAMADQPAVAQSLNRIGNWYANTGTLDAAIDLHQQALRILKREGDETGLLETHDLLGTTRFLAGEYRQALEHLEIAISEARRLGDKPRLASALTMIPMFGGNLDVNYEAGVAASRDPNYWLRCAEEGLEVSRAIGWKAGESFALTTLGAVVAIRGDLGRGRTLAEAGYELARSIGHQQWMAFASLVLGLVWSELEEPKLAELHLDRCRVTANSIGSHLWITLAHSISGFAQVKTGDLEQASGLLSPFIETEGTGPFNSQRSFQLALAHLRLAEGDPRAALRLAESLLALEDASSAVKGVPHVLRVKADALVALGRTADADRTYRDADRVADALSLRAIRWRIMAAHSRLLCSVGDDEGVAMARKAAELVREIGDTIPDIETRERFLARATGQLPDTMKQRSRSRNEFGLSDRELDVLRLAAQGLTNAEIGSQLFISPRTVAQHLQSIYGKLNVNSRTAAAALARQHDLV